MVSTENDFQMIQKKKIEVMFNVGWYTNDWLGK